MLTVVEEMDPAGPRTWNQAADIVVREIFDSAGRVSGLIVPYVSKGIDPDQSENENSLGSTMDLLGIIDDYFNFMVHCRELGLELDQVFWVHLWENLGCIAGSVGLNLGAFSILENSVSLIDLVGPAGAIEFQKPEILLPSMARSMSALLCRKQRDYGKSAISRFGRAGLVVRTHDKIARLKNLLLSRTKPSNESISDTFTDIIGYCALGMMWERGWFNLPFDHDAVK